MKFFFNILFKVGFSFFVIFFISNGRLRDIEFLRWVRKYL